jgi:LacI family transcriptional regulator
MSETRSARNGQTEKMTIRRIARLAGVSAATVSRVLNDRPDVSPETREAVLRHLRSHHFSTNRSARSLAGGRTGLIGVTTPNLHAEYFRLLMSGAAEALYEQDMRSVVCPTLHQHDREVSLLDRLMHGTTDGAILLLPEESSDELVALREQDYPFVVLDPGTPLDDRIPVVSAAHWSGARAAVSHLIALGHRRIAAITGQSHWTASIDRLAGYHAALGAAGILAPPEYICKADFLIDGGYRAAQELLALPNRPTAIFAFNDNMAIGAMRAAQEGGLCIPHDLSLVGFDDSSGATLVSPQLTTVSQPLQEMGRVAVSLLVRLLERQRVQTLRMELATKLIVRGSSGPAPNVV